MNTDRLSHLLSVTIILLICGCSSPRHTPPQAATLGAPDEMQLLVIGGGGSPSHNQVSLEKNVLYLQRLLANMGINERPHILFSDGNDGHRVVQTRDKSRTTPKLNSMLSQILGPQKDLHNRYRAHELGHVDGTANPKAIEEYFNIAQNNPYEAAGRLLYFTGHGGAGVSSNKQNTSMYLWGDHRYRVNTFCSELDKVHVDTPVTLLMVQCYSGGFANVIFKDGDPKKGMSDHARCGFFSTVHDRTAAGCTPDIDEASYKEYSSYFLEALSGTSRMGKSVQQPDYDKDGQTSFDEAHAYALIKSTTIDISIKTSDTFLRHYSKLGAKGLEASLLNTSDYATLLKRSNPIDRHVLSSLSQQLGLSGNDRVVTALKLSKKIDTKRAALKKKNKGIGTKREIARRHLQKHLKTQWPELANPWHPDLPRLLKSDGDDMLKVVTKCTKLKVVGKLNSEYNRNKEEQLELNRERAILMRFVRTAESVALEANLSIHADSDVQARYKALKTLEHRTL